MIIKKEYTITRYIHYESVDGEDPRRRGHDDWEQLEFDFENKIKTTYKTRIKEYLDCDG